MALDASPQIGFSADEIAKMVANEFAGSRELRAIAAAGDDQGTKGAEVLNPQHPPKPESSVTTSPATKARAQSEAGAAGHERDQLRRSVHESVLEDALAGQEH